MAEQQRGKLLTVNEVAALLQVERHHVTNLISAGDLVAVNVGTSLVRGARWRIRPADLERFLTKRQSSTGR